MKPSQVFAGAIVAALGVAGAANAGVVSGLGTHHLAFQAVSPWVFNALGFGKAGGAYGALPEPAMWAVAVLGVGGIGAALRRRRRNATSA